MSTYRLPDALHYLVAFDFSPRSLAILIHLHLGVSQNECIEPNFKIITLYKIITVRVYNRIDLVV